MNHFKSFWVTSSQVILGFLLLVLGSFVFWGTHKLLDYAKDSFSEKKTMNRYLVEYHSNLENGFYCELVSFSTQDELDKYVTNSKKDSKLIRELVFEDYDWCYTPTPEQKADLRYFILQEISKYDCEFGVPNNQQESNSKIKSVSEVVVKNLVENKHIRKRADVP